MSYLKKSWQARIRRLARQGHSPVEISCERQIHLREVRLVLDEPMSAFMVQSDPLHMAEMRDDKRMFDAELRKKIQKGMTIPGKAVSKKAALPGRAESPISASPAVPVPEGGFRPLRETARPTTAARPASAGVGTKAASLTAAILPKATSPGVDVPRRETFSETDDGFPLVIFENDPRAARREGRLRLRQDDSQTLGGVAGYGT